MEKARYLYSELAVAIQARKNCEGCVKDGEHCEENPRNAEWFDKWTEHIKELSKLLPHGSGFDNGTTVDLDVSHAEKLVLHTAFHHMNWTEHTITVTPSFHGINLRISGRDRNQIKEYIAETFDYALTREVGEPFPEIKRSSGEVL